MFTTLFPSTFAALTLFVICKCEVNVPPFDDVDYRSESGENILDMDPSSTPFPLEMQDTHLFSDAILTYDPDYMNKPEVDPKKAAHNDSRIDTKMKVWLKEKIDTLIEKIEANEELEKKRDESGELPANFQISGEQITPLSTLAPNEVYLPIDIDQLIPKRTVKKNLRSERIERIERFEEFINGNNVPMTSTTTSSPTPPSTVTPTATTSTSVSSSTTTPSPATTTTQASTTVSESSAKPIVKLLLSSSTSSPSTKNSTILSKSLSKGRLWKTQFQALRNVSFDVPEKRILTSYPMRRLMMAYFAPRILRFQAAMVLSTLMSEVSRKVFDPLVGNLVGSKLANLAPQKATTTTPAPPSIMSMLSTMTGNGGSGKMNGNSLSQLSQLSPLLGGLLNSVTSGGSMGQDRPLLAEESSRSDTDSTGGLAPILGVLKQFKPSELQSFTQLINNIDTKQLSSLVSVMQTLGPLLKSSINPPTTTPSSV